MVLVSATLPKRLSEFTKTGQVLPYDHQNKYSRSQPDDRAQVSVSGDQERNEEDFASADAVIVRSQ
jgi:hypothetical protein